MKPTIRTLVISTIAGIGILFSGCNDKASAPPAEETGGTEISNHLDLEVVISLFGESENLEDFEKKLNDPERQISNLDLNEDGEVDYLRVVESGMEDTRLVSVQAVIAEDQYQDVASFDVQRTPQGQTQVRVVGDPYIYGQNYVIQPNFPRVPLLLGLFWATSYRSWKSPYYWDHYPSYYRPWRPYPYEDYRKRVTHYRNPQYAYHYESYRRTQNSLALYDNLRRNDYASKHPGKSFTKRNKGVENRYKFDQKKGKIKVVDNRGPGAKPLEPTTMPTPNPAVKPVKPTGKPDKSAGKPSGKPSGKPDKPSGKPDKPSGKPDKPSGKTDKAAGKPAKPTPKPADKSATKPSGKSGGKPAAQPAKKDKGKK